MKRLGNIIAAVALVLTPLFGVNIASAAVDTCTWTGSGADDNWSTDANWNCTTDGALAPANGDSLIFPTSVPRLTPNNDIAGLTVDNVSITGTGYTFSGTQPLTITPASSTAIQFSADNTLWDIDTTISAASSKAISNSGTTNEFSGSLTLTLAGSSDMNINTVSGTDIQFSGIISGTVNSFLLNDSAGSVTFSGANTFTTSGYMMLFNSGYVRCLSTTCLGNSANYLYLFGSSELSIENDADIAYYITADAAATTPTVSIVGTGVSINGTLDVDQNLILDIGSTATDAEVNGSTIIATNKNLDIRGAGSYLDSQVLFNGSAITGDGDILIQDTGVSLLAASPAYAGDVYVNTNGSLTFLDQALGTTAGEVYVADGGVLRTASGSADTVSDNITLAGDGNSVGSYNEAAYYNDGAAVEFTGEITLSGTTAMTIQNVSGEDVTLSGLITGTGNLNLSNGGASAGDFVISGTATNNYVGIVTLTAVSLDLAKSGGIGLTGGVEVVASAVDSAILTIQNTAGNQIADNAVVNLTNDSTNDAIFGSSKPAEVIGSITGDGNIYVTGGGQGITVGGGDTSGIFSGVFTNTTPSTITKTGSGVWDISGASYGGVAGQGPTIDVLSGSVKWGGSLGEIDTTIGSGATLKGTGTAGAVTVQAGGAINVGNSPGCMTLSSLQLNNGATFTEEIAGSTACSTYDQTTVTGTADITNATLSISLSGTPVDGTVYTILTAGSVVGTFSGLANNATVTVNGTSFRVNYTATSVTLTVLGTTTATTSGSLASTGSFVVLSFILGLLIVGSSIRLYRTKQPIA